MLTHCIDFVSATYSAYIGGVLCPVCVCVCVLSRSKEPLKDSVVSTYEEHEDSVYAAEWSSADPWLFASLSYDGRLVINRVPRALKYRILL